VAYRKNMPLFSRVKIIVLIFFSESSGHYLISSTEEIWKVIQTTKIKLSARFVLLLELKLKKG